MLNLEVFDLERSHNVNVVDDIFSFKAMCVFDNCVYNNMQQFDLLHVHISLAELIMSKSITQFIALVLVVTEMSRDVFLWL